MPRTGGSKMIVGYDLGNSYAQISYYSAESAGVETASYVAGKEVYSIPTVLCKRYGTNQWLYGREALKAAEADEGILVEGLPEMALDGEPVQIEGTVYDPVALLTLFFKRSLGLLPGPIERIGALMVTCEKQDEERKRLLSQVLGGLRLKARYLCFQSYEDSFYQYIIHQPKDLSRQGSLLFWYQGSSIRMYRLQINDKTTPAAVYMEGETWPFLGMSFAPKTEKLYRERMARMDQELLQIAREAVGDTPVSSVYLIGEDFKEEWMKESLQFLCRGRRVFLGNNLYSKGACLSMMERLKPSKIGKGYVFLGEEKLKTNVGMRLKRRGADSYYALLDAGADWPEAKAECEFYLKDTDSFELVLAPLDGRQKKIAQITLDGADWTMGRLGLKLEMTGKETLAVTVEDLGFGEFRRATHHIWAEVLTV